MSEKVRGKLGADKTKRAPTSDAGCPMPTNVAGFGEAQPLEGYVRPTEVSPACRDFTPQPGPTPSVPETFKPLW